MKIAILAVQGAFYEHEEMLSSLGADWFEIRKKEDLKQTFDGLILPGGESTVMGKLLLELDLFYELQKKIKEGLPVLGTCAGLILLAEKLSNDNNVYFATCPITVRRNAYGRQLGSFYTEGYMEHVGTIPMAFIRAPFVEHAGENTEVIAKVDGKIVGVKYKNQIGVSFHPEVTRCTKLHEYFLELCREYKDNVTDKK